MRDYTGFRIYEETKVLNENRYLGENELLVFACLYNATSKGSGPLEKGLMIDSFNKVCKQHCAIFNVKEKKITRSWTYAIIKSLKEKDFIEQVGNVQEMYKGQLISRSNFKITRYALETLKRLNLQQSGESSPNALF